MFSRTHLHTVVLAAVAIIGLAGVIVFGSHARPRTSFDSATSTQPVQSQASNNVQDGPSVYLISNGTAHFLTMIPGAFPLSPAPFPDDPNAMYVMTSELIPDPIHNFRQIHHLIHIKADGTTKDLLTFDDGHTPGSDDGVALSPDRSTIAYCGANGPTTVRIVDGQKHPFDSPLLCGAGATYPAFSRDGSALYFGKGFYEGPYGDYTEAELRKMNEEAKNGLYKVDLSTGNTTYLGLDMTELEIGLRNTADRSIAIQYLDLGKAGNFKVRDTNTVQGDIMSSEAYATLPIVGQLDVTGKHIRDVELIADGTGVFYDTYTPYGQPGADVVGYYDLATKKNYYPLFTSAKELFLVPALTKNSLFVLRGGELIQVGIDGSSRTIESREQIAGNTYILFQTK